MHAERDERNAWMQRILENSAAHVRGRIEWRGLADRCVQNNALVISSMDDIHPTFACRVQARDVLVHECDKNFVFYWCTPRTLIGTERLFLNAHPCEQSLLSTWGAHPDRVLFLHERWAAYKDRWAADIPNVIVLPASHPAWNAALWEKGAPLLTGPV